MHIIIFMSIYMSRKLTQKNGNNYVLVYVAKCVNM